MAETLVLGLGNILMSDEGVGVRVIERLLAQYDFPEEVQVMDGGTLGLDLLPNIDDAARLLVVDAVQAGQPPGALVRLTGDDVPIFLDATKISPHQESLQDILALAAFRGALPGEIILWGVQVGSIDVGLTLSPPVAAQVDVVAGQVLAELRRWGIEPLTRPQVEEK
jgi:hydrogenase maturation protease